MGGNVADYSIVLDGDFVIDAAGSDDQELNLGLPGKTLADQSSIIQFMIREARGLHLRIECNNNRVHQERIVDGNFERSLHEVLPRNILRVGERNSLKFTAVQGRGRFSDVVFWFQRRT